MEHSNETFWYSIMSIVYNDSDDEEDNEPTESTTRLVAVERRPEKQFLTKSKYEGTWDTLDSMTGKGTYTFPHRVNYTGGILDGSLRRGVFYYPMSQTVEKTDRGLKARFSDGLDYEDPFLYCVPPDRRYFITNHEGFMPPGKERLTDNPTDRPIPKGMYDTVDGFYNPETKCVVSAYDMNIVLRIPTPKEEKWIKENCRKAWDEPVGLAPYLYPKWTTGVRRDIDSEPTEPTDKINLSDSSENSK